MTKPSTVQFTFGRRDQFDFIHRGKLVPHPEKDTMVHACRVCADPCTGRKQYYCSTGCRIHWYKNITAMTQWSHWRNKALNRDDYECQECGTSAEPSRAHWASEPDLEVHHIVPVAEAPELEFELDNLLTLCRSCHKLYDKRSVEAKRCNNETLETHELP